MIDAKKIAHIFFKFSQEDRAEEKIDFLLQELEQKKLLSFLPQVKKYLLQKIKGEQEHEKLIVRSPFPLSDTEKEEILSFIEKRTKTNPHSVIYLEDKNLIAGVQLSYRGKNYDFSLKHQLSRLEKNLRDV